MNPENTEVPLLATPEAANAAADAAAAGILGDDSLLGQALEGEALEDEIRRQVEYFLSREYLSTDPYLVSQMNSDMYFPITTVATLTTFKVDLEVLVKTLRKSTLLTVNDNGTMVKPSFKIQRNTLILRDIPSSTKVEEVQGIFQGEGCPTTTGIRPDIGDCWFVTFNSEEDALKALDFVRGRTFRDAPVKARIKSENLLRSFTYYPPAAAAAAGDLGMKMGGQYGGYNYYPQYGGQHAQGDHQDHRRTRGGGGGHRQPGGSAAGPRKEYRGGNSKYSNDGVLGTGHNPTTHTGGPALASAPGAPITSPPVPNTNTRGSSQATADSDSRKQRRQPNPRTSNNRKQESASPNTTTTTPTANSKQSQSQQPLQFGLAHFPPLSSQSQQPKNTGYTKDFTKFTKQQLIDIVTSTPVPNQQPSTFPTECLAALAEPNTQIVVSPESNLDRLRPQESSVSAGTGQEGEANSTPSTSTVPTPTPAQPTMTMASLVATHKSIPAPAPAPKKPQPKAKPAPQPKKEPVNAQGKGQQGAKKASPPTNARKGAAQKKKPEEGASQQQAAPASTPSPSSPAPSASASAAAAPASPAVSSPASTPAAAPAAAPAVSPAAPASLSPSAAPSSGSSTPTYAQLAAKAASKQPAPQPKKEAEKKEVEKKEEPKEAKKDEPKKEEKESASA